MENVYEVFIRLNNNGIIMEVNSSLFLDNIEGWLKIDEGIKPFHGHAQSLYLEAVYGKPAFDENGYPNFRYEDGTIIALTKQEKEALYLKQTNTITKEERIAMLEDAMQELILMQMGSE